MNKRTKQHINETYGKLDTKNNTRFGTITIDAKTKRRWQKQHGKHATQIAVDKYQELATALSNMVVLHINIEMNDALNNDAFNPCDACDACFNNDVCEHIVTNDYDYLYHQTMERILNTES